MGSLLIKKIKKNKSLHLISVTEQKSFKKNGIYFQKHSVEALKGTNVIIDFTRPNSTFDLLKIAIKLKKKIVIGTTGFSKKQILLIKKASKKIAILQSGNMSLGINLLQYLSKILSNKILNSYQIEVHDRHHKEKIDYPSGTALMLAHAVADGKSRKFDNFKGKIFLNKKGNGIKNKINFYIERIGKVPGTHSVFFKSDKETIELKHTAQSRDLFADGALNAAKWLATKKSGFYTMQDVLKIK